MSNTMQWVKAETRLPEKHRNYHVKVLQFNGNGTYNDACTFNPQTGKFNDWYKTDLNGRPEEVKVVEWLEELEGGGGMREALEGLLVDYEAIARSYANTMGTTFDNLRELGLPTYEKAKSALSSGDAGEENKIVVSRSQWEGMHKDMDMALEREKNMEKVIELKESEIESIRKQLNKGSSPF